MTTDAAPTWVAPLISAPTADPASPASPAAASAGATLVDSEEFSSIYAGETSTNYYCFPETKCLYYLIKDGAGNGLTADGHYEVKYGKVGDLHVVAAGNEFDWIKAHFVGGPATCAKQ